jgi:hypothetical protein
MGFLMARCAEGDQILGSVIAQSAMPLHVMDSKIFHWPTPLASPAVSLEYVPAKLAISFHVMFQTRPLGTDASQTVTCTSSRSCFRCGFGRPMINRVRHGNRAPRLPTSKLTPASKSAQIISRQ